MLREEYVSCAAALHVEGARTLKDSVAALLPCCTLFSAPTALALQRCYADAEELLRRAIFLSAGLLKKSGLTKYTAVIEARMRLLGVECDASVTAAQSACVKVRDVPPGTRADVYDGFVSLGERAIAVAEDFLRTADALTLQVREGRCCCALPLSALKFLRVVNADYTVQCRKLASGEEVCAVRRDDVFAHALHALAALASLQGADAPEDADALASLAAGGMIPCVPPVVYDVLLRYERCVPTGTRTNG